MTSTRGDRHQSRGVSGSATAPQTGVWQPTDRWLLGIVLAVINFWLFAQTLLNPQTRR